MELKTTEEFVREAHGAACSTWKQRIEKEFPELFKMEFEVGKWYKNKDNDALICYQNGVFSSYGINNYGDWTNEYDANIPKYWREATHEEIEASLISEAKKRGYKKGVTCVFGAAKLKRTITTDEIKWNADFGLCMGLDIIFKDGKWTKILPEEKTIITKEKALKIIAKKLKVSPENIEIK